MGLAAEKAGWMAKAALVIMDAMKTIAVSIQNHWIQVINGMHMMDLQLNSALTVPLLTEFCL